MVTLKVDNKRYTIDGNPTIEQWQELMKWDFESHVHWPYIIQAVTGLEFYTIREMDHEQQKLAVTMIAYTISERAQVELPDFEAITFGQFVDLEYLMAHGTEKSLHQMLDKLEADYKYAQEALYVVENYMAWRTNLFKRYSSLFGLNDGSLEEDGPKKVKSPVQVASEWYRVIVELANDDVLKIKEITALGVKEAFNFMAVRKEKQLAELNALKQQKRTYDLQRTRR
jgi:hypothetical protein